jgi:hypothetical protein
MLFSLLADVHNRFRHGTGRLLAELWLAGCFPRRPNGPPSEQAYRKASAKLPVSLVAEAVQESHYRARSKADRCYEGLRVVLVDGTKFIIPRNEETIEAYGLGSGSVGDAYYPQIHAGAFFDLATATFSELNIEHGCPAERQILLQHAADNPEPTLYVGDAGYNGMAQVYLFQQTGQELLMELKMGKLAEEFRRGRKRSVVLTVRLTRTHFRNYPEHKDAAGKVIRIRLIRTKGTNKLRSKVLLTTLLDERRFKWFDLARLYLQRWTIELAFRHLKSSLRIEHIRKQALYRIRQLLLAAVILFNLSAMIRNAVKRPELFPRKRGVQLPCFEFVLELADVFILAAVCPQRGQKTQMKRRLKAIRGCCFLYDPWRTRPKICQFPPSVFTRCKSTEKEAEFAKCEAIRNDMRILGKKYGQI